MGRSQHLLPVSAWFKKVTYSLHRSMWPLRTWRRYKHAIKCSTHAAKTFCTNREYREFILMNISGIDVAGILAFHKKRNINFFSFIHAKGKVVASDYSFHHRRQSPLPVSLLTLIHHFRVPAPKLLIIPRRPASVLYWGSVQSYSCCSTVAMLAPGAMFETHCIVTNRPSGLLV